MKLVKNLTKIIKVVLSVCVFSTMLLISPRIKDIALSAFEQSSFSPSPILETQKNQNGTGDPIFSVNVPAVMKDKAVFEKDVVIKGKLISPNQNVVAGRGIDISGPDSTTVNNAGVLSLGGETGSLELKAGAGITVKGLTISSNALTALTAGSGIAVSGAAITNTDAGSAQNIFKTISVSGQDDITARKNADTLTMASGEGITLTTNANNKQITISASGNKASGWTANDGKVQLTTLTDSVGIGTANPAYKLDVTGGSIRTDNQLISTTATGTSPLSVTSTTLVSNLNADQLDGQHGSYYMPVSTDNWVNTNGDTMTGNLNMGTNNIINAGTINGGTISGGTISGGNVSGGTLTATAVNGVTTANIVTTGDTGTVTSAMLTDNSILATDLKSSNSPTSGYALTYNVATGGFTWATTEGGGTVTQVDTGNGLSGGPINASGIVALGALTLDWNQTGAFNIVLNNASSHLKILESNGATYFGTLDVGDLLADATYTFSGASGDVLTSANFASTLDSAYINASGDTMTGGLNMGTNNLLNAGTINGATLSGGNISGGTVSGGTLTATAVNGVTTANIIVIGSNISNLTNDTGYITASSSNNLTNKTGNISMWTNNANFITLSSLSNSANGLTYNNTTGATSLTSGYTIPTTTQASNWGTAYSNRVDTWNYPLSFSSNTASLNYNTTNLRITSNNLNTIQDIATSATPTFGGLTLNGTLALGSNSLTTSNTTVVTNLNADKVDGYDLNQGLQTTNSPSFVTLTSTQATGTAPFTVASTTLVSNLNSDYLEGQQGSYYLNTGTIFSGDISGAYNNITVAKINGVTLGTTTATAGNLLIGSGTQWVSNAVSGDITINSSGVTAIGATKVTNGMLAGSIASSKLVGTDIQTVGTITAGTWNAGSIGDAYIDNNITVSNYLPLAGGTMTGNIALGANTITTSNSTVISNLNSDKVDGQHGSYYAPINSPTFTGTVTIPTPFTLGAVSVTTTGTQLNYLNAVTGTTGTNTTNLVFSTSPTLTNPVIANIAPTADFTLTQNSVASVTSIAVGAMVNTLYLKAGNVGIGTTDPANTLDIGNSGGIHITSGVPTSTTAALYNNGGSLYWNGSAVAGGNQWTTNGSNIYYNTGNVGIGTTSPQNKLHIEGTGGGLAGVYMNSAVPSATTNTLYNNGGNLYWNGGALAAGASVSGTTNYIAKFTGSNTIGNSTVFDNGTSVGVGTTDPTSILHTIASGAKTANYSGNLLTNTATSSTSSINKYGLEVQSTGTWNGTSATNVGLYISSVTGGTNNYDAIFNGGGNVGIGTTAPANTLDIGNSGGIHITSGVPTSTTAALYNNGGSLYWNGSALAAGASVSGTTNYIAKFTGSNTIGNSTVFDNGTSVGIGTTDPSQKLDVSGGSVRTDTQLISTVATGTAPLSITSTTKVTNLNADQVDGYNLDQGLQTTNSPIFAGLTLNGNLTLGANTITTSNTTVVTNLNADLLDGQNGSYYAPINSPTFTGTVTIPTPFTLGAVSVTTTGTQLNYLNAVTGTTGTNTTNLVFSTSPTLTDPVIANIAPTSDFTLTQNSVASVTSVAVGAMVNTLYLKEGNVGIGTTVLQRTFSVNGDSTLGDNLLSKQDGGIYFGRSRISENQWGLNLTSSFGVGWVSKGSSGNWAGIAISSDGKYQSTLIDGGYISISSDYGNSWTGSKGINSNYGGISMSSNGKIQAALPFSAPVLLSTDYGNTWVSKTNSGTRNWNSISMSSDGKYISAAAYSGDIYVSTDTGSTWAAKTGLSVSWKGIAVSSDGKYQTAVGDWSNIYVSSDYGNNWTSKGASKAWRKVSISGDGKYQSAVATGGEYVYISSDYGNNWTGKGPTGNWASVTMSADGKNQIGLMGGNTYVSTDFGNTWTVKDASTCGNIAISSDAKVTTCVVYGGYIYESYLNSTIMGNVGIGTTAPTSILHTIASGAKTANYSGNLLTNTATSSTSSINKYGLEVQSTGTWNGTSATNVGLYISSVTGGTNNYDAIFNGGGNVGIGTTAPANTLDIGNSGGIHITSGVPTSTTAALYNNGGTLTWNGSAIGGSSQWTTAGSNIYYNTGNVGIGTTNPGTKLEVNGALRLSGTSVDSFITPASSSVPTKINIPLFDPGAYGQIISMGLPSSAQTSSRSLSLFDGRTVAHQPTLAVFSVNEADMIGLSWDGDANKAYLKTLSANIGFRANNTDIMSLLSGGNVGVGTTNPRVILQVKKAGIANFPTLGTASGNLALTSGNDLWGIYAGLQDDSGNGWMQVMRNDAATAYHLILQPVGGNVGIGSTSPTARLQVVGADSLNTSFAGNISGATGTGLVITNAGNVGIGTTAPVNLLDVTGTGGGSAGIHLNNAAPSSTAYALYNNGGNLYWNGNLLSLGTGGTLTGSGTTNYLTKWTGASTLGNGLMYDNGTNVGIGTTSPQSKLEVNGVGSFSLGSASAPSYTFTGDLNTGMWSSGADTINFSTGGAEAVRINSSGNVGIGTASPAYRLDLKNNSSGSLVDLIRLDNSALGYNTGTSILTKVGGVDKTRIKSFIPTGWTDWGFSFDVANRTDAFAIRNDGNVGVGTTSPGQKLDVQGGNINTSGNINASGNLLASGVLTISGASNSSILGNVGIGTASPAYRLDTKSVSNVEVAVFTGSGLNNGTIGGSYLGSTNNSTFTVIVDGVNGIKTSTLNAGGSGYAVNDTFTVDGGGVLATGKVLTLSGSAVATYSITAVGSGYSVANGITTTATSGAGAGLAINITVLEDTFKWKKDSGSYTSTVAMTGSAQTLQEGVTITFGTITGHTLNDQWASTATVTNPLNVQNSSGTSGLLTVLNTGNVGIGTASPGSKLEVNGVGSFSLGSASAPSYTFTGDLNTGMWSSGTDTINFSTGGTEAVRITSNGNVGIGIVNPGCKLSIQYQSTTATPYLSALQVGDTSPTFSANDNIINGQIYFPGTGAYNAYLTYYPRRADGHSYFRMAAQSSNYGDSTVGLLVSGNVGIGTTVPSYHLQLSDNSAGKPGGGSWSDSSDSRLKKDVIPVTDATSKIMSLNPVQYKWINPTEHGNQTGIQGGFIAQELKQIFPNWVNEIDPQGKDKELIQGGKAMAIQLPFEFDALLVEGLKEVNISVESLATRLTSLEEKVSALGESALGGESTTLRVESIDTRLTTVETTSEGYSAELAQLEERLAQLENDELRMTNDENAITGTAETGSPVGAEDDTPEPSGTGQAGTIDSSNTSNTTDLTQQIQTEIQAQLLALDLSSKLQGDIIANLNLKNLTVIEDATFAGDLKIEGHLTLGKDSVGRVEILAGETEIEVIFEKEYLTAPIVSITPRGESTLNSDLRYAVTDETTKGFKVKINKAQGEKVEFNWNAFESKSTTEEGSPVSAEMGTSGGN